jgi:Alginate export
LQKLSGSARAVVTCSLGLFVGTALCGAASAAAPACPPRPLRWQDDCSLLVGKDLTGLDRLRYLPVTADGDVWVTVGGEARTRMDLLKDSDFGLNGAKGYVLTAGRLLLQGDLRTKAGPRAFVQLGIVDANNRKPTLRSQDKSQVDVTQAFVDLPATFGEVRTNLRVGRQEIDLSGNRLITARDGATLRRAFQAVKVDVMFDGVKVALVSAHPIELRDDAFSDRTDRTEDFSAISVDLPAGTVPGGVLNLFAFDRLRNDAHWLRAAGDERRQTYGARYAGKVGPWTMDLQGQRQVGHVSGKPVRAFGAAMSLDRDLPGPHALAVGFDAVIASGDHGDTNAIESFDPTYPNNGGLSDATVFYQTNYVFAGGGMTKGWKGAVLGVNANLLARQSVTDGIFTSYAGSRAIPTAFDNERLTSLLMQVSYRKAVTPRTEVYASLVRCEPLGAMKSAGGEAIFYSRIQLTARF